MLLYSTTLLLSFSLSGVAVDAPVSSSGLTATQPAISKFDEVIQRHARNYRMNWLLVSAVAYTESRFNENAVSRVGAKGLLQVMPTTGRHLGFSDVGDLESNIEAGTSYLKRLILILNDRVPPQERVNFALAAYNAGLGHVYDAQKLARQIGLDPHKWFDNVEKAILLLQKPEYAKKAKYGYCRGAQPVAYVAKVRAMEKKFRAQLAEQAMPRI